jgi:hypothetical protein
MGRPCRGTPRREGRAQGQRERVFDCTITNSEREIHYARTTTSVPEPTKLIHHFKKIQMSQSKATRSIIDTHRHIFGPKLRKKFVENIGFDDSKPLPQANAGEMFFYRESVDVDYSWRFSGKVGCRPA